MFDDPKKELERLEQELLAVEDTKKRTRKTKQPEDMQELLKRTDADRRMSQNQSADPEPERKSNGIPKGLLLALILETLGLVLLVAWWLLW